MVMIGECCGGHIATPDYDLSNNPQVMSAGYLANMRFFLQKYRKSGFPVAHSYFATHLCNFRKVLKLTEEHFELPSCEMSALEKGRLVELKGKGHRLNINYVKIKYLHHFV